jgi:hypothetical protein
VADSSITVTTAGIKSSSLNQPMDPGLYWLALKMDTAGTTASQIRSIVGPSPYVPQSGWISTVPGADCAWRTTGLGAGVLPTAAPSGMTSVGSTAGAVPGVGVKIF